MPVPENQNLFLFCDDEFKLKDGTRVKISKRLFRYFL